MPERERAAVPVLSRASVRELDRLAAELYGLPGSVLMENAGRGAAEEIARFMGAQLQIEIASSRIAVVCGPGNNGGDGCVVARHLHNAGAQIELFSTVPADALRGEAAWARSVVDRMGLSVDSIASAAGLARAKLEWESAHVVVDALLGTG